MGPQWETVEDLAFQGGGTEVEEKGLQRKEWYYGWGIDFQKSLNQMLESLNWHQNARVYLV